MEDCAMYMYTNVRKILTESSRIDEKRLGSKVESTFQGGGANYIIKVDKTWASPFNSMRTIAVGKTRTTT